MRLFLSAAVACGCLFAIASHAQESAAVDARAAANEQTAASDATEPESTAADARESSKSEKRRRRRGEEAAAATEDAEADNDDGVICRRQEVTGSHFKIKVCTTREEREAARQDAKDLLRDVSRPIGSLGADNARAQ